MSFDAFVTGYSVAVSVAIFAALVILLYYLVFNRSLMAKINATTSQSRAQPITEFTVLRCSQCGFEKKRQFEIGDYVGKIDAEKCPHDGSQLVVSAIAKESTGQG